MELMLAIALLALVMAMLWGGFSAITKSKIHAEGRLAADQTGRSIMWQLSKELRGLVQNSALLTQAPIKPLSNVLLVGHGQTTRSLPLDSITFSTTVVGHRRSLNAFGSEEIVSYDEVPNPDHRGWFLLTRTQRSGLIVQNVQPPPPLVLADNLISLHIRYFDGSRWVESWNSQSMPVGQNIPFAVAIDLEVGSPSGKPVAYSTRVTVPMAFQQR